MKTRNNASRSYPLEKEEPGLFGDGSPTRIATIRPSARDLGPDADTLLTVQDVAELLKVPVSWVYEHTRPGCRFPLPYLKLGKYLRFVASDILNFLDSARSRNHRRPR